MVKKTSRIPVLESLIDACRMLPENLQGILFFISLFFIHSIGISILYSWLGSLFNVCLYVILTIQILLILILIQKNVVYRRISKIENAIKHKILWVKSKEDGEKIIRYLIIGIGAFFLIVLLNIYYPNTQLLLICSLFCLLYFLKGLFFVPTTSFRLREDSLTFIDESKGENIDFTYLDVKEVIIAKDNVSILTKKEKTNIPFNFSKVDEQERLKVFLRGILSEIKVLP